jgi:hypothetical protein
MQDGSTSERGMYRGLLIAARAASEEQAPPEKKADEASDGKLSHDWWRAFFDRPDPKPLPQ